MNRVEQAIIMAAGRGERLRPITDSIPKPLVTVNGIRIIDTIIEALRWNEIKKIVIVIGYLKEQFVELYKHMDDIILIDNPFYDCCNNISSMYVAREYLENSIVIDGDQYIRNRSILHKTFGRSGYAAIWTDQETHEWLLDVNEGVITGCHRDGGKNGWQLFGISRWCAEDGRRLKKDIEKEFITNKNRNIYWDDIAMFCNPTEYSLGIDIIERNDLIEIDNVDELRQIDKTYEEIMENEKKD